MSDHDRIPVVTSLPPAVDGHLRCFLRVSVPTIHWTIPKYPTDVQVRLKWWGEDGNGILFRCAVYFIFTDNSIVNTVYMYCSVQEGPELINIHFVHL